MAARTLDLPKLILKSTTDDVELTLQTYLSLELPRQIESTATLDELLDAIKQEYLWIGRTRSCHLNVTVVADGEMMLDGGSIARMMETVSSFEVGAHFL